MGQNCFGEKTEFKQNKTDDFHIDFNVPIERQWRFRSSSKNVVQNVLFFEKRQEF